MMHVPAYDNDYGVGTPRPPPLDAHAEAPDAQAAPHKPGARSRRPRRGRRRTHAAPWAMHPR